MSSAPSHGYIVDSEEEFQRLVTRPTIAIPTVVLRAAIVAIFIVTIALAATGTIPMSVGLLVNTLCSYLAYTVLHEASHGLVSTNRTLIDMIGRVGFMLVTLTRFFRAYRFLHMTHHRHTNDRDRDPDYFCGQGHAWTLPLRWMFMDSAYVSTYFRPGCYSSRPLGEKIEFWLAMLLGVAIVAVMVVMDWMLPFLLLYLIPTRVSLFFLAITFDYLPHFPHTSTAAQSKYRATNNRIGLDWTGSSRHCAWARTTIFPITSIRARRSIAKRVWLSRKSMHEAHDPALVMGWRLAPAESAAPGAALGTSTECVTTAG